MDKDDDEPIIEPFREVVRRAGGYSSLIGFEFYASLFITLVSVFCLEYIALHEHGDISPEIYDLLKIYITVAGALLGFIIAAYALMLSAVSKNLKEFFAKSPFYCTLKLDFSFTAVLIGACIVFSTFGVIAADHAPLWVDIFILFWPAAFTFLWSLFNVIVLLINSVRKFGDFVIRGP